MKKVRNLLAMTVLLVVTTGWAQQPTPTPPPTVSISGIVTYCSNPTLPPLPGVTMTLTGTSGGSTTTDAAGNYSFTDLPFGGSHTVTPTKAALPPGSTGINTVDVFAVVRYLRGPPPLLIPCRLMAADVNGVGGINTVDLIAIQRFSIGLSTGIANVGRYQFTPANRTYPEIVTDQTNQNYDALVFGDVASPFVE